MKNKLISSVLSVILLSAGSAFALDIDPKFYVGGELQAAKPKAKQSTVGQFVNLPAGTANSITNGALNAKQNKLGAGLFVGSRLNENVGVELGYSQLGKTKYSANVSDNANNKVSVNNTLKTRNMYFDVLGFMPINECVDLIGSVGVGQLKSKLNGAQPTVTGLQNVSLKRTSSKKTGLRLGLGAQYKFNENVGARFMVRHQKGNEFLKNVNSAGLGLFYQF